MADAGGAVISVVANEADVALECRPCGATAESVIGEDGPFGSLDCGAVAHDGETTTV